MLTSLARKVSLTLVASIWLSGCGGRSLEPDTDEWYGEGGNGYDTGLGGAAPGGTTSSGGATARSGSSAGGAQPKTTTPRTNGGTTNTLGGAGGYYSTTSKGGSSGYSSSTSRGGVSGYSSSIPRGGVSGYSSSIPKGGVSGSSWRGGAGGVGGSTFISRGGAGGTTSTAKGGTSAISCPISTCARECAFGRWQGVNGCYDCACAPPNLSFSADIFSCPSSSLSIVTEVSITYADGRNWWDLKFQWTCSALTTSSGEPLTGTVVAYVRDEPSTLPLEGINRTFYMQDAPMLWQIPTASLSAAQGSGATVLLTSTDETYLSIRREDDRLVGGLYLSATVPNAVDVSTVTLSAPFSVIVPILLI